MKLVTRSSVRNLVAAACLCLCVSFAAAGQVARNDAAEAEAKRAFIDRMF